MRAALNETARRRALQHAYNEQHGITPVSVTREVTKAINNLQEVIAAASKHKKRAQKQADELSAQEIQLRLIELEHEMQLAAEALDFERAIMLRREWQDLRGKNK